MNIPWDIAPGPGTVREYAEDAVKSMLRMYKVQLDYSPQSLRHVDAVLGDWKSKGAPLEQIIKSLYAFGSYAGEVMLRAAPGRWVESKEAKASGSLEELPFLAVHLDGGLTWKPINLAFALMTEEGRSFLKSAQDLLAKPAQVADQRPRLSMNEAYESYLNAFVRGEEIPGGLSYKNALAQCKLDGSMESLKKIDHLLDQIRERQGPKFDEFLAVPSNQNFLHLLAFYTGNAIATSADADLDWLSYDEFIAIDPSAASVWPKTFESSIVCLIAKPSNKVKQMLPLVPIVVRLFEGPHEKSVWFSATGFI